MRYKTILLNVLLLSLSMALFAQKPQKPQMPDKTMNDIKINTQKTAQHTEKGSYEIVTLVISLSAFITAGITLYYSVKTYRSQKQTELNTASWTMSDERRVLKQLGIHCANCLARFLTIEKAHVKEGLLPGEGNFVNMKFNTSKLHTNMPIKSNTTKRQLYELADTLEKFNLLLESRMKQISSYHLKYDSNSLEEIQPFSSFWAEKSFSKYVANTACKQYFYEEKTLLIDIISKTCKLVDSMWEKTESDEKELAQNINVDFTNGEPNKEWKLTNYIIDLPSLNGTFSQYYKIKEKEVLEFCRDQNSHFSQFMNDDDPNIDLYNTIAYDVNIQDLYRDEVDLIPDPTKQKDYNEYYTKENGGTIYINSIEGEDLEELVIDGYPNYKKNKYMGRALTSKNIHIFFDLPKEQDPERELEIVIGFNMKDGLPIGSNGIDNTIRRILKLKDFSRIVYTFRNEHEIVEATFNVNQNVIEKMREDICPFLNYGKPKSIEFNPISCVHLDISQLLEGVINVKRTFLN